MHGNKCGIVLSGLNEGISVYVLRDYGGNVTASKPGCTKSHHKKATKPSRFRREGQKVTLSIFGSQVEYEDALEPSRRPSDTIPSVARRNQDSTGRRCSGRSSPISETSNLGSE